MDHLECDNCRRAVQATAEQSKWIEYERARGLTFIMVKCNHCGNSIAYNPQTGKLVHSDHEDPLRCPVVRCTGYVVDIEDLDEVDGVLGCGECGTAWRSEKDLAASIEEAVDRFPYRAACYRRKRGHWVPSGTEPDDYEDVVETEPYESGIP